MYSIQRRLAVMVGSVALGFAGVLGAGLSAAAAETADMGARSGIFYVYEHDDFKGGSAWFTADDYDLTDNTWEGEGGRFLNDNISSVINNTDRDIVMRAHSGCGGDAYLSKKYSEDKDLTNNRFDNVASCIQFT